MPPQTMRSQSTQPMQQMQPMQQARQAQARSRASGDVTTDPTPGTPRGDLLALLVPDFVSLPPDSRLPDAVVTAMLAELPATTKQKMHDMFCRPPGPFYCEAERTAWAVLNPWCNNALVAPVSPPPMFVDDVIRSAWISNHAGCPTPPPVLSDHVCTPGEPGCGPAPATNGAGLFFAGVAALGLAWLMFEGGKQARGNPRDTTGLVYLKREPLDRGGYTSRGKYFGVGAPLYRWSVEWPGGGYDEGYVRGATREAAMKKIREKHPGAKFVN